MVEAFAQVAAGKAGWTDTVVLEKQKKVSGSGVLQDLSDGLHLSLRDAVTLMMTVSDNRRPTSCSMYLLPMQSTLAWSRLLLKASRS